MKKIIIYLYLFFNTYAEWIVFGLSIGVSVSFISHLFFTD